MSGGVRFTTAEDEMFGLINEYATNAATLVISDELVIRWPGKEDYDVPVLDKHWARVSTQVVDSRMVGFVADGVGRNTRRYEVAGLLFVQLFAPKLPGAYEASKLMGDQLVSVFRSHRTALEGGVSFVNVRATGLNPEERFYRVNVVTETEYYQLD